MTTMATSVGIASEALFNLVSFKQYMQVAHGYYFQLSVTSPVFLALFDETHALL